MKYNFHDGQFILKYESNLSCNGTLKECIHTSLVQSVLNELYLLCPESLGRWVMCRQTLTWTKNANSGTPKNLDLLLKVTSGVVRMHM